MVIHSKGHGPCTRLGSKGLKVSKTKYFSLLSDSQEHGTVGETTMYHTHPCGVDKSCGVDFPVPAIPK